MAHWCLSSELLGGLGSVLSSHWHDRAIQPGFLHFHMHIKHCFTALSEYKLPFIRLVFLRKTAN